MTHWEPGHHPGMLHHGNYTIYRYIREFCAYRWDDQPVLLGKCESLLEAKLLASLDQALRAKTTVERPPPVDNDYVAPGCEKFDR